MRQTKGGGGKKKKKKEKKREIEEIMMSGFEQGLLTWVGKVGLVPLNLVRDVLLALVELLHVV